MFQKSAHILLLALLGIFIGSCSTNPVTGKSELSFVSVSQQIQIGRQNYAPSQQSQGGVYYLDPSLNAYVSSVGNKLAVYAERDLPYEFVVLNNGVPNAWALPGGKIAINRGLLVELEDESELAAVLGHEIVHAAAGHGASQMSRGMLFNVGAAAAGIAGSTTEYGRLINLGTQLGSAAWMASYGRDDELESDEHGIRYMAQAGYDVQGAVELQRTFVELSEGRRQDFLSGLFASHPPSQRRVQANAAHATKYPAGGIKNRAAYQRAIAQLTKDQLAYDAEELAIKALNDKKPKEALEQLDIATSFQPNEGQFWELRGHAWEMLDELDNADKAFSTAIRKNDRYFQHWLARGLLRKKMGRTTEAMDDLKRSEELLPNATSALALGELAENRGDKQTAMKYFKRASSARGQVGAVAQEKLIRYDLPENPGKYIASGLLLSSKGELIIAVENRANISVSNIRVRLVDVQSGLGKEYSIRGSLNQGQQSNVRTGLTGAQENFRVQVIQASVN